MWSSIHLVTEATRALLKRALKLSLRERDLLVRELVVSMNRDDGADPDEIERSWAKEIARRIRAYDAGRMKAVPADKVLAEMRADQARDDRRRQRESRAKRRA